MSRLSMDYLPPIMSELRIWLLGEDRNDKISVGNLLLQKNEFETEPFPCHLCAKKGRGQFQDLNISVVITPNLFDRDVPETEITRALVNCEAVSAPGPHVLLLILQPETSAKKLRDMIKIMNSWSDQTLKHTIVLLMEGEKKFNSTNESKLVISLLKERLRWKKFNRIQTDQSRLVTELFGLITNQNERNERNHLILDIYESTTKYTGSYTGLSDNKDRTRSSLQRSSQSAKREAMPVVNLVLFGSSSAVKTSAVNTILGLDESSEASELKTLYECVKRDGVICAHHATVVKMPQLYSTSLSLKDVMDEAYSAMKLCSFNINTFLLVLNVSPLTDEDKGELEVISDIFDTSDKKFWDSLMVLFIYQGSRQDKAVTEFIYRNRDFKELLRKCGHKHHILSIDQRPNHEQLSELLQKIKMVPCYSYDTCLKAQLEKRIQLEDRIKEVEEKYRALIEIKRKAETEIQRSSTNCVRIVLVGRTGNGKSATGNTILNRKAFKSQACFKSVTSSCQREHGFVERTSVVVVDTPGLFDTQSSQEEVKEEILKCISLLSPGPHVFLLVLRIGRFTNEEKETLNLIEETFGKNAGMFTMIIFTHGDLLEDQTIESCLEDADPQLKKLIRDCGGRYHVIDNTKQDESKQVIDLLEKINRMVEKNGGGFYTNEMFEEAEAAIKLEMEKILKSKKEEMEREKRLRNKYEVEMAEMERRIAEQKQLMEKERKEKEEELNMKEQHLRNELKRRESQEEKERKKREQDEEQRRIEKERKQKQLTKEWQKIEEKLMRLEEEQQKRDQEYREKYEREEREMEKRHKERLKRKHEEEYQKKLKQKRSEWELKEKKMIEEFEQGKRKREDKEKKRIQKELKEKNRIEKEYENSKIEISRQIEEWKKIWVEEWDKRVNEERERREEEREKLRKLIESFEQECKEEAEKRKREDKAIQEQEEQERREMEEQYERMQEIKHEKEWLDIEKECAYSEMSELSKHKNKVVSDKMKERNQTKPDTQRERPRIRCCVLL